MNKTIAIIKEDSQTSRNVGRISKIKIIRKWPFCLLSYHAVTEGYLSFSRQISAINAPKAITTVITCNRSIMIS